MSRGTPPTACDQMTKEKKTSKEIAATILACCIACNLDIRRVTVWPTAANGWDASFLADLTSISPYISRFERIVFDLRAMFDLIDEYK
jgi:hypothetical protein